jgi:hypothetical protein
LIIDELGPLEFERSEGWVEGFSALQSKEYKKALVVIRPSLVNAAKDRWEISHLINLDLTDQEILSGEDILSLIGMK